MRSTERQREIMTHILKAPMTHGDWLDIDQLIEALASVGSKQSVQCSLRYLVSKNVLERLYGTRRGKRRAILMPTPLGFYEFGGKGVKTSF